MGVAVTFNSSSSYKLKRKLGAGGCAEVFLYSRRTAGLPDQDVVIKILKGQNEESVKELLNEGTRLAQLKHPHILTAFGYEKVSDTRFGLVLEYIPGETLREVMGRVPASLRGDLTAYVVRILVEALAVTHAQGIIHGDVSSRNVLFSRSGQLKLSDFGLARRVRGVSMSIPKMNKGSIDYLAPERWGGELPSAASDVFAVGILAYEILKGINPLACASSSDSRRQLDVFLEGEPWREFSVWADFFQNVLARDARERLQAPQLLSMIPKPNRSFFELQKELSHYVVTSGLDSDIKTQPLTKTLFYKKLSPLSSPAAAFKIQALAIAAFAFFLFVPGAIGMDHGVAGFLRPYLLTLTSDPWGEVFIDKESQGYTPLLDLSIPSGYHRILWRGRGGETVSRTLMAFPNGSGAFQIVKGGMHQWRLVPLLGRNEHPPLHNN